MVVDGLVPEQGLVAVAPGEVLGADVLVGVLDAVLQGGLVAPVLPMLGPQVVGVGAGEEEAGDDATISLLARGVLSLSLSLSVSLSRVVMPRCVVAQSGSLFSSIESSIGRGAVRREGRNRSISHGYGLLDGDLAPELWIAQGGLAIAIAIARARARRVRTSSGSGVLLDGLTLLDEGVLGRGQAALDVAAEGGVAQLGGQAGSRLEDLALGEHF